jgi:drug/metabolite transporter (DMT)-like permease
MSATSDGTRARLTLLVVALLFSTGGAAIKATTLSSAQIAGFRSGIAALAVLLIAPVARRRPTWRALVVGIAYAATVVLFVLSNKLTTAANTIFLQSTAPMYVLLVSPWLLGESIRRRDFAFVALAAAGLSLFFIGTEPPRATAPDPTTGNLLAVGSGVAWAGTLVGLRWMGRVSEPGGEPVHAVVVGNLLAFAVCMPAALPIDGISIADATALAYLGVCQIALPYLLLVRAVRHVSALEASMLLLVEPALNPVWAFVLHREVPGPLAIAGGVVVLGASLAKAWADGRSDRTVSG